MNDVEDADDRWVSDIAAPYRSAMAKLLGIRTDAAPMEVAGILDSATDEFWAFICEYNLQGDQIASAFAEYMDQIGVLRNTVDQGGHNQRDRMLQCLGLGMLILGKMDEVYGSFACGLTWTLDHPVPR